MGVQGLESEVEVGFRVEGVMFREVLAYVSCTIGIHIYIYISWQGDAESTKHLPRILFLACMLGCQNHGAFV